MNTKMALNFVNSTPALVSANVNKVPDETTKSPGLCARLAYGTANCVKRFGLGVAAAGIITPLTNGVSYLAQVGGLIPEPTLEGNIRGVVANYQKMGFTEMNADKLLNATCYMEELAKQLNLHVIQTANGWQKLNYDVLIIKSEMVGGVVIGPAIKEEILFRGLIQDVCLTEIPKYVIKKIAPGKETILDTTIAKAARIVLTSAAFSAWHLQNKGVLSDSYVSMQLVATFAMGIGFGILKESKTGLLGSIGAHMANNFVAIAPQLWSC